MAKADQANNLAKKTEAESDPISELSDIMKFDPVEAALEKADAALQLDLESELIGDLARVEAELGGNAEAVEATDTAVAEPVPVIPDAPANDTGSGDATNDTGTDDAANDTGVDKIETADGEIDSAFDEVFDDSLENPVSEADEPATPAVPPDLENQLNTLLAGLGDNQEVAPDENEEAAAADAGSDMVAGDAPDEPQAVTETVDEPQLDEGLPDNDAQDDVEPELMSLTGGRTAALPQDVDDTIAEIEASLSESETAEDVPVIETADIVDEAVAVNDDLDIPDVSFENDVPPKPDFDELDDEFTRAFSKISEFDDVEDKPAVVEPEPDPEPQLGEKLDNIFAEMTDKAAPGNNWTEPTAQGMESTVDAPLGWDDTDAEDRGRSFGDPVAPIGAEELPPVGHSGDGGAKRGVLIAVIVAAIAVAGGIGAFAISFGGGDDTTAPALVKADDGPIKVKPKDPGGKTVPNEDKKVYERVAAPAEAETPTQEKLISTAEEPVDVAAKAAEPRVILPDPSGAEQPDPVESAAAPEPTASETVPVEKNDDRILPENETAATNGAEELVAIKPRRVKTLVVKPDGTLVPREEPAAVTEELRTDAPAETAVATEEAAAVAGDAPEAPKPADVAALKTDDQPVEAEREVTFQAPSADEPVTVDAEPKPADEGVVVEGIPFPTPAPRAEFEAERAVAAAAETRRQEQAAQTETKPAETPAETQAEVAAVDPAPAANPEWWVQISSQPSRASAQASYAELAGRYGSIIGGRGVNIVRAEIEGKGTYYRVRIAGGSRSEAAQLCSRLKSAGAGCFIAK